jgi:tetratricopeptide (TPR) repeat protein
VYDTGEADGRPFISMELVEGQTLGAVAVARPTPCEVGLIVQQAARALAAAHTAGVVHRDVKPENLMLRPDGIVKVLDFGLARRPADPTASAAGVVGTPAYMAPEQARGEEVGPPADVYALGLVLYELLTGRHACPDFRAVMTGQPLTPPPPSRLAPDVPQWLDSLVERMLTHDPLRRPTAHEVEAHLGVGLSGRAVVRDRRPTERPARVSVGRRAALDLLHAALTEAADGRGSVVFVTGEPGDGKTTLVEAFLVEAAGAVSCVVAAGRCSERLAGAEAYLPVLDALDGLVRADSGAAEVLRRVAPSWQVRLGAGADALAGPPQERLKREFAALLAEVTWSRPLILFLDDAHWADPSSTDLLAYLGGRVSGLRVLVVVTYRPSDLALARHPLGPLKLDLVSRRLAHEVTLEPLTPADLTAYVEAAFPGHRFPSDFVAMVYARTGGHPLFMADLLRYLRDRGAVVPTDDGWALTQAIDALAADLPESIRSMVERELGQVSSAGRQVLDAASVQGAEFDSGVLAAVVEWTPEAVEDRLDELDRTHALVRFVRSDDGPGGGLSLRYRFAHVLYQHVLLTNLRPTRRVTLSRVTAAALLARQSDGGSAAAAELALLFEAAREPGCATGFFRRAARNAVRVSAHQEAVALARRGLALLPKLTAAERVEHERPLLVALGVSLMATRGFAAPEVEETYRRAVKVADDQSVAERFPVLYGLWNVYLLRAEIERCATLAGEMALLAAGDPDPVLAVQAANVVQQPLVHRGEFTTAFALQEQGLRVYDAHRPTHLTAVYGEDPGIGLHLYRAITVWALGRPDEAVAALTAARVRAVELGHPFDLARTLYFGGFVHMLRGDTAKVREAADELGVLADEEGFPLLVAGSRFLRGWADAQEGQLAGVSLMRTAADEWKATGTVSHRPHQLTLLGRAVATTDAAKALALFDEAESLMGSTGERFLEAELHRLRGEVLAIVGRTDDAVTSLRRAMEIARRQGALVLEQRTVATLNAVETARHDID